MLRTIAGVVLLLVGVAGCLLPIMPGIPFLVAGVAVLGTDHAIVKRGKQWMHSDHPWIRRVREWLERQGVLKPPQT